METFYEIIDKVIRVIGIAVIIYYVPYFLARGWNAGKRDGCK